MYTCISDYSRPHVVNVYLDLASSLILQVLIADSLSVSTN